MQLATGFNLVSLFPCSAQWRPLFFYSIWAWQHLMSPAVTDYHWIIILPVRKS